MRHDRLQMPLYNTRHCRPWCRALVQLKDRDEERYLDIHFFRRRRFHLRKNGKRFLFRTFVVLEILIGRRRHSSNEE